MCMDEHISVTSTSLWNIGVTILLDWRNDVIGQFTANNVWKIIHQVITDLTGSTCLDVPVGMGCPVWSHLLGCAACVHSHCTYIVHWCGHQSRRDRTHPVSIDTSKQVRQLRCVTYTRHFVIACHIIFFWELTKGNWPWYIYRMYHCENFPCKFESMNSCYTTKHNDTCGQVQWKGNNSFEYINQQHGRIMKFTWNGNSEYWTFS